MNKVVFVVTFIILVSSVIFGCIVCGNINYSATIATDIKALNTSFLSVKEDVKDDETEKNKIDEKEENIEPAFSEKKEIVVIKEEVKQEEVKTEEKTVSKEITTTEINEVYVGLLFRGSMTAYGKDCCGSDVSRHGITATGFDLKQSLTYSDSTFGNLRVLASDRKIPLYSVIKVSDPIDGEYKAIVLDRAGSVIGINKEKKFDLAVESESFAANNYGVHKNVVFEVLRVGK